MGTASDEALFDLLGRHGLPVTLARLAVLQVVARGEPRHMTTEQLCAAMVKTKDGLGFSTFKSAIYGLADAGVVGRVIVPMGKRGRTILYEFTDNPPHRHLYCQTCQRIEEILNEELESRITAHFARIGFKPAPIDYALPGLCAICATAGLAEPGMFRLADGR